MNTYTLPYFGEISLNEIEEYYSASMHFDDRKVDLDMNFGNTSTDKITMNAIKNVLDNLIIFDQQNKEYIQQDFAENGDAVKLYVDHHLDELSGMDNETEESLLKKLKLVRIGFYPEEEDFIVFDYSLGRDITDYLVVVNTDKEGKLDYITMES